MLAKVTTKITHKVPAWSHCNLQANILGQPSTEKCRFCVKEKGYYRCALYNEVLSTSSGTLIDKVRACEKATAGYRIDVEEEVSTPEIDTKTLIKATIAEYNKVRKSLIKQGYPESIAEKAAAEHMIGGK
jgi:hypothetical protein